MTKFLFCSLKSLVHKIGKIAQKIRENVAVDNFFYVLYEWPRRHQVNSDSAVMLKADANSHEDQMTGCHLAFKKANIACMSRLYAKGKENLMSKVR